MTKSPVGGITEEEFDGALTRLVRAGIVQWDGSRDSSVTLTKGHLEAQERFESLSLMERARTVASTIAEDTNRTGVPIDHDYSTHEIIVLVLYRHKVILSPQKLHELMDYLVRYGLAEKLEREQEEEEEEE